MAPRILEPNGPCSEIKITGCGGRRDTDILTKPGVTKAEAHSRLLVDDDTLFLRMQTDKLTLVARRGHVP